MFHKIAMIADLLSISVILLAGCVASLPPKPILPPFKPIERQTGSLIIENNSVPSYNYDVAYRYELLASGGTAPYAWSVDSGSLPAGLKLDANSGFISGTPTPEVLANSTSFIVKVTDSTGATVTKLFWISINTTPSTNPAQSPSK